jgi:hypothetical protein
MSSIASQQVTANSSNRVQSSSEDTEQVKRRTSLSQSTTSIDSQTLLLNDADNTGKAEETPPPIVDDEPRKCWICYVDETEDTPTSSRWRSPCPCALTAHESCLLDWVADMEAPNSRRKKPKIQCPQCKKDIIIARPRNLVVDGVKAVERFSSKLVVPSILLTLAGSVYTCATVHGYTSAVLIFGTEEFEALVRDPASMSAKWMAGFPLIPIVLILSRTTLADNILPALPILFFASRIPAHHTQPSISTLWPPSPAITFALLPYARGVYNDLWRRLFAEKEKRWTKEVQPRAGEGDSGQNQEENHHGPGFEWNLEMVVDEEIEEVPEQNGQAQQVQDNAAGAEANNNAAQPQRRNGQRQEHNLILTGSRIADVVMGALAFPAIASIMGELLKFGLPRSWTQPLPFYGRRPGLLHTKWGRSIIGGCLFVVMKDTLLLYSKYRLAQDHKKRRVMNYDKKTGKAVD